MKLSEKRETLEKEIKDHNKALPAITQKRIRLEVDYLYAKQQLDIIKKQESEMAASISNKTVESKMLEDEIEELELNEMIERKEATDKKNTKIAKANIKKGEYSEPILLRVQGMPEDIVKIIYSYLPNDVWVKTISVNLYSKINKIGDKNMIRMFIGYITSRQQFITLLSREEIVERSYEGTLIPDYSRLHHENLKRAKVEIYSIIVDAMNMNPLFAFKLLKMVSVFSSKKWKAVYPFKIFPQIRIEE